MPLENKYVFITTLPADGYKIALLYKDEIVVQVPVLSFLVFESHTYDNRNKVFTIFPATFDQVYDFDSQAYVIIRPDGVVEEPENATWDCLADFEKELAKRKIEVKKATREKG